MTLASALALLPVLLEKQRTPKTLLMVATLRLQAAKWARLEAAKSPIATPVAPLTAPAARKTARNVPVQMLLELVLVA
jgi:hypothetical protein